MGILNTITEKLHGKVKEANEPALNFLEELRLQAKELIAFAAYGCSFGAKWWGGYAKPARTNENVPKSTYNNCVKLAPRLEGSVLTRGNYFDLEIPDELKDTCIHHVRVLATRTDRC